MPAMNRGIISLVGRHPRDDGERGRDRRGRVAHRGGLLRWFAAGRITTSTAAGSLGPTRRGRVAPQATELRVRVTGTLRADDPILIAVSAPEVRPSSFDMTFRVRGLGDDGSVIADGRCTMVLVDPATGESRPVPASLRRDLMDIEAAATDYC